MNPGPELVSTSTAPPVIEEVRFRIRSGMVVLRFPVPLVKEDFTILREQIVLLEEAMNMRPTNS